MSAHPLSHPITYIYIYLRLGGVTVEKLKNFSTECQGFLSVQGLHFSDPLDVFFRL